MAGRRKKRHTPEQIVRKLREADAMLNAGKDQAAVLQALEVSEATYLRCGDFWGVSSAPAAQRSYPTHAFITPGTEIGGKSTTTRRSRR